jgi:hypothetical protein
MQGQNNLLEFNKDDGHKNIWGKNSFHKKTDEAIKSKKTLKSALRNISALSCVILSCILTVLKFRLIHYKEPVTVFGISLLKLDDKSQMIEVLPLKRDEVDANNAHQPKFIMPRNFEPLGLVKFNSSKLIPPGSQVKAKLLSGASAGRVKAVLLEPLIVDGDTLIEAGAVLIGSGHSTEERLFISFTKIVFRDGSFKDVEAQALEAADLITGLKGSRIGYHTTKLAAGIGLNFASGMAGGLQEKEYIGGGVVANKADMKNALLNGAQSAALEYSKSLMESFKNDVPLIEVPAGTVFYILFDGGEH